MNHQFRNELELIAGAGSILYDEPMRLHTTFRIGGTADIFVTPQNEERFAAAVRLCRQHAVPYYVIGNGSNLLVADRGIRGVVFQIYHTMDDVSFEDNKDGTVTVTAGAGIMLSKLARTAAEHGLTGLEFASGIPGTFGGAMTMNAGAYGGEMSQCAVSARVMDCEGNTMELKQEALALGYRTSIFQQRHLNSQRREKQPLEYPSAGSTFKRPEGYFAGKLIHEAGMRGFCVGDACVSEKHSGFVINKGEATAEDVRRLIKAVQDKVMEQFGVALEMEVKMLGEFED